MLALAVAAKNIKSAVAQTNKIKPIKPIIIGLKQMIIGFFHNIPLLDILHNSGS